MADTDKKALGLYTVVPSVLCVEEMNQWRAHRTVLIVEDNLINREILRKSWLRNISVPEAGGDGQEAPLSWKTE